MWKRGGRRLEAVGGALVSVSVRQCLARLDGLLF
jgi:hypothetical protein